MPALGQQAPEPVISGGGGIIWSSVRASMLVPSLVVVGVLLLTRYLCSTR